MDESFVLARLVGVQALVGTIVGNGTGSLMKRLTVVNKRVLVKMLQIWDAYRDFGRSSDVKVKVTRLG